jgi:chromosome segregation ATPase
MRTRAIVSGLALLGALCALALAAVAQEAAQGEPDKGAEAAAPAAAQGQAPAPAPAPPQPSESQKRAEKLNVALQEQQAADSDAKASQDRVDKLDDETQKLLSDYRKAVADTESYQTYAKQLEVQVASQNEEMAAIDQQLQEVETTSREVSPLMTRMLDTLEQFVALDVPFLAQERSDRVKTLKAMMDRADVTISEKYRRIVEAYQVEMDYGRTIEAYEGKLGEGADARTVEFLRVGRVALLYQTLDRKETGYWDADKKAWVVDNDYREAFEIGVGVAKKARAPEMLTVPVQSPKEAKS